MSKGGRVASPVATTGPMQPFAPGAPAVPMAPGAVASPAPAAPANIYTQAAQGMQGAAQNVGLGAGLVGSGAAPIATGMGMYQNPFEQQVLGAFQDDLARQTAIQQSANRAAAAGAGAFGGSRHGLVEAQTNEAAQRNLGQFSAGLRSQGFNTAAQLASQDIQNRLAAGAGLLGAAGAGAGVAGQQFGMGQDIANQQFAQGALTQGMNQMLLDQARGMFGQYVSQPQNLLDMRSAAASMSPLNQAVTAQENYTPGLFDYLSLGFQTVGGAMRPGGAMAPGGRWGG
jgi:hypothetical protein